MWNWLNHINIKSIDHRQVPCCKNYDCMTCIIHSTFKFYCSTTNSDELILPWQSYDVWSQVSACASHDWASRLCLSHHTRSLSWGLLQADGALKPQHLGHKPRPDCTVEAWKGRNTEASLHRYSMTCSHITENHTATSKQEAKKICVIVGLMEQLWVRAHTRAKEPGHRE